MAFVRRYLFVWSLSWLLAQTVALSVFLPCACCADMDGAHAMAMPDDIGAQCPMKGPDGEPCPMHRPDRDESSAPCAMAGACHGPDLAMASLFSLPGILPSLDAFRIDVVRSFVADDSMTVATVTPDLDPRPPRA